MQYGPTASFAEASVGRSQGETVAIGLVMSVMVIVNIVGNSLTIVSFCTDSKLRTLNNFYLFNLAITDLVIGFVCLPLYAVHTLMDFWPFGSVFCKIYNVLDFTVCTESSLTILCISIDRLLMVKMSPGVYMRKVTKRRTVVVIVVSWIFSTLLYSPAIIGFDIWRGSSIVPKNDCFEEFLDHFEFTAVASSFDFLAPGLAIVFINSMLYADIRRRARNSAHELNARRNVKAAKNLAGLVITFLIFWTPYTICALLQTLCPSCVSEGVFNFFFLWLWLNSSLNPLVYAASNPRFRQHYVRFLRCYQNKKIAPEGGAIKAINVIDVSRQYKE